MYMWFGLQEVLDSDDCLWIGMGILSAWVGRDVGGVGWGVLGWVV